MPLEIRELVIKVTIEPSAPQAHALPEGQTLEKLKDSIVKECMQNILARMRFHEER
jgi:hypothetical protein